MKRYMAIAVGLVLCAGPGAGQTVEFGGEVRPRFEVRDPVAGLLGPDPRTAEFTSMRTRVSVEAEAWEGVRALVQLQDVRIWGSEETTTDPAADALDLHQGWAELGDPAESGVALRLGRQEIAYGGERLIGALNWVQQARSFDGLRLRLRPSRGAVVDGVAMQLGDEDGGRADGALIGVHGRVSAVGSLEGYVWHRTDDALLGPVGRTERVLDSYTFGARWAAERRGIDWRLELAYQTGTDASVSTDPIGVHDRDVSAYLVAARVGAAVTDDLSVDVWYDRLSGDDDPGDEEVTVFNTLFATNHKFYGYMDLFLDIPAHTRGRGLQDLALKGSYVVAEKQSIGADLHGFFLTATDGVDSGHIGEELDLTYRWRYAPGVSLTGGLSYFWSADAWSDPAALRRADDDMVWGYLMLDVLF